MKSVHTVAVALASSRIATACFATAALASAVLIALLPIAPEWRIGAETLLLIYTVASLRRLGRRKAMHAVVRLEVGEDLRGAITERCGRRIEGTITDQTYVGPNFASVLLRPDGRRLSRAIPIFADMLPAEDFRRLRVLLRLGRSPPRQPFSLSQRAPSKVAPLSAFD